MPKPLNLALVVVGIVLLVMGLNASESFASEVSELVNDAPSDKSIGLIVAGLVALIVGGFGFLRSGRAR